MHVCIRVRIRICTCTCACGPVCASSFVIRRMQRDGEREKEWPCKREGGGRGRERGGEAKGRRGGGGGTHDRCEMQLRRLILYAVRCNGLLSSTAASREEHFSSPGRTKIRWPPDSLHERVRYLLYPPHVPRTQFLSVFRYPKVNSVSILRYVILATKELS